MTELFRVSIHTANRVLPLGELQQCEGVSVPSLQCEPSHLTPLMLDFDVMLKQLDEQPRCYVEPDGSFVCRGERQGRAWSWEGNLYEGAGVVQYIDLWGACPAAALQPLWRLLPNHPVIQVSHAALYLDSNHFHQWLDERWG